MTLSKIQERLGKATNNEVRIYKGHGYFYFISTVGFYTQSIMTRSEQYITEEDITSVIKEYEEYKGKAKL